MKKFIVAISRQYGSRGNIIGAKLAEALGVEFCDKTIVSRAAKESGFSEAFVEMMEREKPGSFLYAMSAAGLGMSVYDEVFIAESKVIKEVAQKGSAVIIGRCADYILRNDPACIRVFIHAPMDLRIHNATSYYDKDDAESRVKSRDKSRAAYYNYFTANKWGELKNYDITLNSAIGVDKCVGILKKYVEEYAKKED